MKFTVNPSDSDSFNNRHHENNKTSSESVDHFQNKLTALSNQLTIKISLNSHAK